MKGSAMNQDDLRLEIKKLTLRLQRIERHLELDAHEREQTPVVPTARPAPPRVAPPAAPPAAPAAPPVVAPPVVAPPHSPAPPMSRPLAPQPPIAARQSSPPAASAHAHSAAAPPTTRSIDKPRSSWETFIGIKVLGGIGAIIVVIGAAFFAREYGGAFWFALPAAGQAFIIAAFGGLLLLGGEIALRTLGRPASLGLYGAGLGVLYMDALATFHWFEIVSREASFLLMGLVAVGGFAITLRTRFLTIGVLSLLGGFLAPILLWPKTGVDVGGVQALAFLTMLSGIALALSAWQPRPYRPLRYVTLGFMCVIGLVFVIAAADAEPMAPLVFISIWWTMFMAEAALAAMRRQSPVGNVVISLLSTAAYVTCAAGILTWYMPAGDAYLGVFTAMIAVLCAGAALHFGPGLDGLRGKLDNAMDKLAVALWAQAGVLVTVAAALQFDGYAMSIAWLAMALAAIEIGRRLPSTGVSAFGLIVGGLAIASIITIDQLSPALQTQLWSIDTLMIDRWAILGLTAVLALHVAANRVDGRDEVLRITMPVVLAACGALGWLLLTARQADGMMMTALWLGGAVVMLALEQLSRRERHLEIALLMLLVTALRWLLVDGFQGRLDQAWNAMDFMPILNPQMGLAAAIALAGWWGLRRMPGSETWRAAALIPAALVLLCGLGFEVDRLLARLTITSPSIADAWPEGQLRALWLTTLFVAGGLLMILHGHWRKVRGMNVTGWTITIGSALTCLLYGIIFWRIEAGPPNVPIIANVQFGIGAIMIAALIVANRFGRETFTDQQSRAMMTTITYALIAVIGFVLGTLEIDHGWADNVMAKQMGFSIYWALYGVALVLAGFIRLSAASRYIGLALLAFTIGKVLLIDMGQVEATWRVLSLIVSGLLLIATSMAYAKLTPGLLKALAASRTTESHTYSSSTTAQQAQS